jgi:hypothetical protein
MSSKPCIAATARRPSASPPAATSTCSRRPLWAAPSACASCSTRIRRHVDTARLLFERGADANQLARNEHIQTAAIHAASAAEAKDEDTRYELVKLALEHGADPNLEQGGGFRAIDAARQNGDTRVEQLLLEHGARP